MANILIADDHDLVRDTIAAYLGQVEGLSVQTAPNLAEAHDLLRGLTSFDLTILDYNMPGMNALDGLSDSIAAFPATKFALMSGVASGEVAHTAMSIGAVGYFPKSLSADAMVSAVKFVLSGERYFPFDLAMQAFSDEKTKKYGALTERETQVLRGLCKGQSNKEIARDLDLQEVTVKLHVKNSLAKLGVKNRTQAALQAQEDGFT